MHRGDLPSFADETYSLQFWSGNRITLYLNDISGNSYQVTTTSTFADTGKWYLVTGTWDSAGMRIYVNGQLEASNATPVTLKSTPAGGVNIGAQTTSIYSGAFKNFPFDGMIDSVSIFNMSLSAGEIMWNYAAPLWPRAGEVRDGLVQPILSCFPRSGNPAQERRCNP